MKKKKKKANVITLNDVDGKGLGLPLHTIDPCCAHVVSSKAGLQASDQNPLMAVNRVVHPRWDRGAVVHPQPQVCGLWVSEQTRQQRVLTLLPHYTQGGTTAPEHIVWI